MLKPSSDKKCKAQNVVGRAGESIFNTINAINTSTVVYDLESELRLLIPYKQARRRRKNNLGGDDF